MRSLVDGDRSSARTIRHQFPRGGKVYFQIYAEGDDFEEEILHEAQLSKEAFAGSVVASAEQKAADIRQHFQNKARTLVDITTAYAEAREETKKLGLPPAQEKVVLGDLQREMEALIRQFRTK